MTTHASLKKEDARYKSRLDVAITIAISFLVIAITIFSSILWKTKSQPYVDITIGHAFFPMIALSFAFIWFIKIRNYPLSYLGINRAKSRMWYFIAPLGALLGFGIGVPSYIVLTKIFPALSGGGMASNPPRLAYPLYIVMLVETIKYPLVSVIPHNILFRGAVIKCIVSLNKRYFVLAFLVSTAFYIAYHLPFDLSFSAFYFNFIWNSIAVFLLIKSESIIPAMIFHMCINYVGIMMSWGYYTFN